MDIMRLNTSPEHAARLLDSLLDGKLTSGEVHGIRIGPLVYLNCWRVQRGLAYRGLLPVEVSFVGYLSRRHREIRGWMLHGLPTAITVGLDILIALLLASVVSSVASDRWLFVPVLLASFCLTYLARFLRTMCSDDRLDFEGKIASVLWKAACRDAEK